MKRTALAVLALTATLLLDHGSAFAQDNATQAGSSQTAQGSTDQSIDMFRKDIRSQKKQIIAANLPLTDTEAQKFWPVYDQYTAELVQINNDKYALIKEYAQGYDTMTDAQAQDWTKRALTMDANVAALRQKYLPNFYKVLPPKKTALYEQVERKVQMLIDAQLALQLPLIQP